MIRVLVVDDSEVIRELIFYILGSDPEIEVIAGATNGEQAFEAVASAKPDVITMDIHMPGMDGFDTTRRIMENRPTPIVIVTGTLAINEQVMAFRAVQAGALAVLPRPVGPAHPGFARAAADLVQMVKLMSEVKVVRRWNGAHRFNGPSAVESGPIAAPKSSVVAIGASTGGPQALQLIVQDLPGNFPAPVLIVQHITSGFTSGFAEWLGRCGPLPVSVATDGETILPGHIYIAPDERHMHVASGGRLRLWHGTPGSGLCPSVARLFQSVANVYGNRAVAVLLSGMGKDGAQELKLLKDQGAVTIAQNRETSVVHGMPGEAIRLNATNYVLPPGKIATALVNLTGSTS